MKTYSGKRMPNVPLGIEVLVHQDGRKYPLHHYVRHSPTGMEWGYEGQGPADLAYSILMDFFGRNRDIAEAYHQDFKRRFVSRMSDWWELGEQEIKVWFIEAKLKKES